MRADCGLLAAPDCSVAIAPVGSSSAIISQGSTVLGMAWAACRAVASAPARSPAMP
jgi:hypothetical protein